MRDSAFVSPAAFGRAAFRPLGFAAWLLVGQWGETGEKYFSLHARAVIRATYGASSARSSARMFSLALLEGGQRIQRVIEGLGCGTLARRRSVRTRPSVYTLH